MRLHITLHALGHMQNELELSNGLLFGHILFGCSVIIAFLKDYPSLCFCGELTQLVLRPLSGHTLFLTLSFTALMPGGINDPTGSKYWSLLLMYKHVWQPADPPSDITAWLSLNSVVT